jgi:hypothetical protein
MVEESGYFPLPLMSKCIPYKDIESDKLYMRAMKGKDEKFIANSTLENLDEKMNDLLRNVIKGIDPLDLTLGDRMLCMVRLAIESYGSNHMLETTCGVCFKDISLNVDLSKLEFKELPEDFEVPKEVELSDGNKVYLRLLTVKDEMECYKYEQLNKDSWLFRYALTLVDDKSMNERINYLENLSSKEFAKVRAFQEKYYHGPIMETKYKCKKCGGDGVTAVPFRVEMLFPSGEELVRNFGDGM